MNTSELSNILTRLYNNLGNKLILKKYKIDEPFKFKTYVRKVNNVNIDGPYDYIVEVYSDRPMPRTVFDREKNERYDLNFITYDFKELMKYIDPSLKKVIKIVFQDVEPFK